MAAFLQADWIRINNLIGRYYASGVHSMNIVIFGREFEKALELAGDKPFPSGDYRFFKCRRHTGRIFSDCDGGIYQNGVGADFHGVGSMARPAESGVDDYRHRCLFDDNFEGRFSF